MKKISWFDRKALFPFLVMALVFVVLPHLATAQICTPAPAGLISWYRGENSLLDARSGHNGTSPFNAMTYSAGKVGQAFDLPGLSAGNRWYITDDPGLNPSTLTVEAWIKTPGNGGNAGFIASKSGTDGNSGFEFFFGYPVEGNRLRFDMNGGAGGADLTGNIVIADNTFHHVAATYDGATIKLYVDGVLDAQKSVATTISYAAGRPLVIGGREYPDTFPANMPGIIDEFAIYSRALTLAEIQAVSNAASAGKCNLPATTPVGLVAWYTGDGNALDSRSRNDGTLLNGTTFAPGLVGQGFSFDGADDYISIPKPAEMNVGTGDLSIEYWVKFNNAGAMGGMISGDNYGAAGDYNGWLFNTDGANGGIGWLTRKASVGTTHSRSPVSNLNNGTWYHLAGVRAGGVVRFYIDGELVASGTEPTPIDVSNAYEIRIGALSVGSMQNFSGVIDEVKLYNRALSTTEVKAVASAGALGTLKPAATVAPTGQAAWFAGDGNANDLSGNGNNGVVSNGARFAVGKVGQGFTFDGADDRVTILDSNSLDLLLGGTIETWIYANNTNDCSIISKGRSDNNQASYTWGYYQGNLRFDLYKGDGSLDYMPVTIPGAQLVGSWNHIAVKWDTATITIYLNGVQVASQPYLFPRQDTPYPITLGSDVSGSAAFNGKIDEVSLYDHPLTASEIQSIYNAGLAGKLKAAATIFSRTSRTTKGVSGVGGGTSVTVGDATVSFTGGSGSGITHEIPIDAGQLPPLPMGLSASGLTFDIATSAAYTGNVNICFNVPAFTPSQFAGLRVFHLESGIWVDRTATGNTYSNLCTTGVASLSPFAIAAVAPSAANVSVSGRVFGPGGYGLSNVRVSIAGIDGVTRTLITSSLGYYRFDEIEAGETYVISVAAKRYEFAPSTRILTVNDAVDNVDFFANQ